MARLPDTLKAHAIALAVTLIAGGAMALMVLVVAWVAVYSTAAAAALGLVCAGLVLSGLVRFYWWTTSDRPELVKTSPREPRSFQR